MRILYQAFPADEATEENQFNEEGLALPQPGKSNNISVRQAMQDRRSIRGYRDEELSLYEVSELAWAAQGITNEEGYRTAPSAGATYPLELFLAVGEPGVSNLESGLFRYIPEEHSIKEKSEQNVKEEIVEAALGQNFIKEAPVAFIIGAEYNRTTDVYGDRGKRYVKMEAGHAAQNMYLMSETLGLGMVTVGAFNDEDLKDFVGMEAEPVYIIPVGRPE